jgi:transaldolase
MATVLEQLREMTTVVADTGELDAVRTYKPVDCTTNPSLVLKAFDNAESKAVLDAEIAKGGDLDTVASNLPIALGVELSKLVPGRISTEVEASLSFDTEASIARARQIIAEYDARGVGKDRILIKLAATWEGIRAAEVLQKEGIDCNLTLIFSLTQAVACADAGAFLISPFVGRITDWFKKAEGVDAYAPSDDPGVKSVQTIYNYYKSNGIDTIVMGASFRNTGQIKALAGCDNLTISPALLEELGSEEAALPRALSPDTIEAAAPVEITASSFRFNIATDPMANELLAGGIRSFDADFKKMLARVA